MTTPPPTPPADDPTTGGDGAAATTSTGLDPKVGSLLAYALGWVSGLILLLLEKEHREVRFHAAQSILVSLVLIGLYIVMSVVAWIPVIGLLAILGYVAIGLAGFALWIFLMIQGYQQRHVRLPVIGAIAEQWAQV